MFPAAVAELLEHTSTDQRVEGSNPAVLQLITSLWHSTIVTTEQGAYSLNFLKYVVKNVLKW
jgi:hypothetical protein